MDEIHLINDTVGAQPHSESPAKATSFVRRRFVLSTPRGRSSTWHWHDQAALIRVTKGQVLCLCGGMRVTIGEGEALFLNVGCLHMFVADDCEEAVMDAILVAPAFIADPASESYARCVAPLITCQALPLVALTSSAPWEVEARRLLDGVYGMDLNRFGGELLCRGLLTQIWLLIAEHTEAVRAAATFSESQAVNEQRAKRMLAFIQAHYADDLTIDAIAASASISRSECFRCFKRAINKKPIEYLTEYRVERAVDMLLNTSLSITDICFKCGFSSPSYFGKVFRGLTGLPPRSYRQRMERASSSEKRL